MDAPGTGDMPPLPAEDNFEPVSDFNEDDHDDLPF